ncbi:hypothetical protein DWB77_00176 [Streptomyces hundungensis]|uniref:Uncharacterized protein n=1 Tax=Streptomyces hundungensis TaxID=1077946 RepID=A0A387H4E9_9ACTN|nr:hypothetical protein DWB77_00176 [Streptomyces hundungensis]
MISSAADTLNANEIGIKQSAVRERLPSVAGR